MTLDEIVKDIAETVKASIGDAVKSVSEKYDAKILLLQKEIDDLKGVEKPIDVSEIKEMIKTEVSSIETKDNFSEKYDGKFSLFQNQIDKLKTAEKPIDISEIKNIVQDEILTIEIKDPDISHLEKRIDDYISAIQPAKDGISPDAEEVAKAMEHKFAIWALGFERQANDRLEKAVDRMPKAKDGRDAFEIEDFDLSIGEDGRTITASLKRGEVVIEKSVKIPSLLDRGVFIENASYEKGDGITYGGSFWIVQKDSPLGKPGTSEDFRLAVKRGRDGKEVIKLEKPETVKVNV